ncbi:hypothetical protein [uncultured Dechloromonas sp.]|uniref:hypothetical protein n=1 Tax=uncultured Dechloromonas sp. TaxID=171719 RepID=UPI0025CF5B5D|nr:hypothetical protein [uncultured Dechloromonas sp.]
MPYIAPEVAIQTIQAKALARRNRSIRNTVLLIGYLLGIGGAIAWVLIEPNAARTSGTKMLVGLIVGYTAALVCLHFFERKLIPVPARCPECGYGWEIKEGRGVPHAEIMEYWCKCPGCGTLMGDEVLELAVKPTSLESIVGKGK